MPTTEDFNLAGRHVVLGLPAYDGRFPAAFQRAVVETMTSCRRHGVTVTLAERTKSALIDKTRDEIVHGFLHKTEGTDLLMIDSDIVWEGEDVLRLLAWTGRYGFVVGPYCTKTNPPQFYYDLEPTEEGKVDQNADGLIRLRSAPGGFNCVARGRLEKMVDAYPELRYRASRGEFKGAEIAALHMMYLRDNPDGSRSRIGEDIAFCNRYRERVGDIWMDPAIVLAHLGEQEYRMSYIDWIAQQQTNPVGPQMYMEASTRYGTMEVLGNDNFIGNSLRQYGEWAQAELDTLLPLIKEGAFVADVGANIGTHTLAFARAVGKSGLVVAYEPQEKIANILQRNVDRNLDGYHIEVVAAACAERHGTIDVPSPDYCRERNFGAISLIKESGIDKFDTVPTVLVDDAFSRRGWKADLIKIDVEGMEDSVLYGARETIKNSRPILFVENNTKDRSAQTIASIRDVTENYVLYWHIAQYYNPDNFSGNKTNAFARFRPEANILAIPNEKWDSGVCDILSEDGHLTPVFSDTETWEDAVRRIQDIAA